jgi:hypothetical protein
VRPGVDFMKPVGRNLRIKPYLDKFKFEIMILKRLLKYIKMQDQLSTY